MQWEHLTAADFREAMEATGVCVLALGVMEKHGEHLPLGTDFLNAHKIACLAAEKEPAVVFPPFYLGQIYEARCFPGTITIPPVMLLDLIQAVCDEIGRNGFRKIVLYNGHGGNTNLLRFLAQCALWEEKPYGLYMPPWILGEDRKRKWEATCETKEHGHACECETSISLASHAKLVKMERVPEEPGAALGRMMQLPGVYTGVHWYANYPEHYAGDARSATARKGRIFRQILVDSLAECIALAKADQVVPSLSAEFFARVGEVAQGSRDSRRRGKARGAPVQRKPVGR